MSAVSDPQPDRDLGNRRDFQSAHRLVLPGAALLLLGIVAIIGLLFWASSRQDRLATENSVQLATNVVTETRRNLQRIVADVAWDRTAYQKLAVDLDSEWADTFVTYTLMDQFEVEAVFVIDGDNRTRYAALEGQRRPDFDALRSLKGGLGPMLEEVRAPLQQARPEPGQPLSLAVVAGYLAYQDRLFFTAAAPLAGNAGMGGQVPNGSVLMLAWSLDQDYLSGLALTFGFKDLRLIVEGQGTDAQAAASALDPEVDAVLPIIAYDGSLLGWMTWAPDEPGEELLADVLGPVTALLAIMTLLGGLMLHRSLRAAKVIDHSAQLLADSEARFRNFAESASDWFWETGPDYRYRFLSERLYETTGGRPEAVLGMSLLDFARWLEELGSNALPVASVKAAQPFRDVEHRVVLDSGEEHIFRLSGRPFFANDGSFQGFRGTGSDITAEVEATNEASRMSELLFDAVANLSEGFVLFDADGRLVVCNDRYRAAYPNLKDMLKPGTSFDEILRIAAERGNYQEAYEDIGAWISTRLVRHLDASTPVDRRLSDGHWYRISEHATRSGGIVKVLMDITELKRHEQELGEQSTLLQMVFNTINQGLAVFDQNNQLLAWNANFLTLMEYPEEFGIEGQRFHVIESYDRLREAIAGPDSSSEAQRSADGSWASESDWGRQGREYLLGEGRAVEAFRNTMPDGGFVVTYTDITERKRFVEILTEVSQAVSRTTGEEFFQSLVVSLSRALEADYALIGVLEPHGDGLQGRRIRTLAVADQGRIGANFAFDPDRAPGAAGEGGKVAWLARSAREHFPSDSVLRRLEPESYLGERLLDSEGRFIGMIAVLSRSVLERRDAAEALLHIFAARAAAELERLRTLTALQESEHRYRQLVERAPYGIIVWDGAAIRFANSAAHRLFAVQESAELEGKPLGAWLGPDAPQAIDDWLAQPPEEEGSEQRLETEVVQPSGETRDVEIGAYPFAHEGASALLLIFNDVTRRKRAEQALQHSQKMEAVGQLAGGVAHEFNNMLTAIGGFARMAQRDPGRTDRVTMCLGEITKASDRAASLTQQLLNFSRKKGSSQTQIIVAGDLVRDLKAFLKPVLGEVVGLEFDIRDESVLVEADPSMLSQAIVNLAINGRDAMPEGGTITLSVDSLLPEAALRERHPDIRSGRHAAIAVTDTGSGIDKHVLDRIFEPFFTTKEQGKGTGLGLPMVYNTVTSQGGVVDVVSEVGRGTTFTLYLPAQEQAAPEAQEDLADWLLAETQPLQTVLLVEDEDSVRRFVRMVLEDQGYEVAAAESGEEALEVFADKAEEITLLITDVIMPGLNGPDLARQLLEEKPDLKVIFMSGYSAERGWEEMTTTPGRAYIDKPIDPKKLLALVQEVMGVEM